MPSLVRLLLVAPAMLAATNAQGVIMKAQGTQGSPASLAMQVKLDEPDANVINRSEIGLNVVNECGRTLLLGNIDIGEQTEILLSNKTVTSVTKGSKVAVTVRPVDENGKGPFFCDLDQTSNANGGKGQIPLTVAEKDGANGGDITLTVSMPANLTCIGASTGDVCTVRCNNAALFGGCFAVQQTDVTPKENTPQNIVTAQNLQTTLSQVQQDQKDLPTAIKSNEMAGTTNEQGPAAVDMLLGINSKELLSQTKAAADTGAAAGNNSTTTAENKTKGANAAKNANGDKGAEKNATANADAKGENQTQKSGNLNARAFRA